MEYKKLYEMNEAFTSKTCSNCGVIDKTLGNKNVYQCKHCSFDSNRDYNGAINIHFQFMMKTTV